MSTKTYFINSANATYNDNEFAWFQSLMLSQGIIGDPETGVMGLEVIQNGTPDMSVLVGVGKALIEITKSGRTFKVVIENDAQVQVVVPANSSGSNRVDAIIARVDVDVEPNALKTNVTTIELVTGSGATALTDGAIDTAVGGDGWYRLANVTVANADTSIITAEIADTRAKVTFTDGMAFDAEFISASTGASDANKVPKTNASGQLDKSFFKEPVVKTRTLTNTFGDSTTQLDITNPSGTTFRYTYDTTGTNPNINTTNVPTGTELYINGQNFSAANNGAFVVTGSGANYFEVTNASGVVESNKTLGTGSIKYCYIKPSDLLYVVVEVQAGGGGGGGGTDTAGKRGSGGGAGGYAKKKINASSLGAYELTTVGVGGTGGVTSGTGGTGGTTSFGSHCSANGGIGGVGNNGAAGDGGSATGGDININGNCGLDSASSGLSLGNGGQSVLGYSVKGKTTNSTDHGTTGGLYGGGGGGGARNSNGGAGGQGIIIITEYFN